MKIIADENIPYVKEVFGCLGEVFCYPGRQMTPDKLADADVLLVRSVTAVNETLLRGSSVKFVGTATIGTDHIDQQYLRANGIVSYNAAGSNSNSVAEYVVTALLTLARKHRINLSGKTLGIIGYGNIGTKVAYKAGALEMNVLLNDPPLQRSTKDEKYVSLDTILQQADVITCHVPLTRSGDDATFHLIGPLELAQLKPTAILINTSRGPVVNNQALKVALRDELLGPVVLDVWENEPGIDVELLERTTIASPHIAGYSFDGKVNGTVMLHQFLCKFLGRKSDISAEKLMPPAPTPTINLQTTGQSHQSLLTAALLSIYDILRDDLQMRGLDRKSPQERPAYFDQLRKLYPVRREAQNTTVSLTPDDAQLAKKLEILGFMVK